MPSSPPPTHHQAGLRSPAGCPVERFKLWPYPPRDRARFRKLTVQSYRVTPHTAATCTSDQLAVTRGSQGPLHSFDSFVRMSLDWFCTVGWPCPSPVWDPQALDSHRKEFRESEWVESMFYRVEKRRLGCTSVKEAQVEIWVDTGDRACELCVRAVSSWDFLCSQGWVVSELRAPNSDATFWLGGVLFPTRFIREWRGIHTPARQPPPRPWCHLL